MNAGEGVDRGVGGGIILIGLGLFLKKIVHDRERRILPQRKKGKGRKAKNRGVHGSMTHRGRQAKRLRGHFFAVVKKTTPRERSGFQAVL